MLERLGRRRKPPSLLLRNLECYSDGEVFHGDLRLTAGRVAEIGSGLAAGSGERTLDLDGHLAYPGLINAHDHLELDFLPRLGSPPYPSFYDWADDVYHPDEPPIRDLRHVSLSDRLWWGAYKNTVAGVTTVMHHDTYHRRIFQGGFPVRVTHPYRWAHSLGFGVDPREAYASGAGPFVIHAAEGVDQRSEHELDELYDIGVLADDTILVHGIAITSAQWRRLAARGVGLVWCPTSNLFLFGKTVDVGSLPEGVDVALGTDSTISGSAGLLDELRMARNTGAASAVRLLEMVTTVPAAMLALETGCGRIQQGGPADVIILTPADSAASLPGADSDGDAARAAHALLGAHSADLALVLVAGRPMLADPDVAATLGLGPARALIDGSSKWLVGDLPALRERIAAASDDADAWNANPVWRRLQAAPS